MANTIKQKRGTTDPGATDLVVGELAINTTDGGVFTKTDGGTVVEVGSGGGGASAINDLSDAVTYDSGISIGLGTNALASDDGTDNKNTALGYNSLNANTSGDDNTAVGYHAGQNITTGRDNVMLGSQAGDAVTTGQHNVLLGYDAGSAVTGGYGITAVGYMAGRNIQNDNNIAIGKNSLSNSSTPTRCTAIGISSLYLGGTDNVVIGYYSGQSGGSAATRSTALGNYSGFDNEGDDNVFVGYYAGYAVTTGDDNVFLGSKAGEAVTTGSNNIVIGYDADASSATVSNEITLGNASITKLRVPGVSFEVAGGQVTAGAYTETVHALSGTDLDPANGAIQTVTLSANTTLTESLAAGESMLLMVADGTSYAVTWPTMTWVGGSAPTLATSGYSVIELWKVSSTLYGAHVGDVA